MEALMDTIQVTNPILIAQALMESIRETDAAEFERTFVDTVHLGNEFTKLDHSKYSATLTEASTGDSPMAGCQHFQDASR
jgi:hypothetical protein